MEKIGWISLLLLLSVGCMNRQPALTETPIDDSLKSAVPKFENVPSSGFDSIKPYAHEEGIYCESPINVDTIIGDFRIRYKWMPNDLIIVQHEKYKYADNSFYLDINYKNNKILANKEFRTTDFPEFCANPQKPEYELRPPFISHITDSTVLFDLGFYRPDSDVGGEIRLTVTNEGTLSYEEIDPGELGEE